MEDSKSVGIFSDVNSETEYITDLHREVYMKISSDAIDILKFNLIIITAFTALLSLLYGNLSQFAEVDGVLLIFGALLWIVSSCIGWYLYSRCQYAINDQAAIFLNQTPPDLPQTPLSTHFINHQLKSEILSTYIVTCFLLSILSVFLFSFSIISSGSRLLIALLIIFFIFVVYVLTLFLISAITLWKERSAIKHGFRRHGFAPHMHVITRIWSKIPRTENSETYDTEAGDQILVVSGDLLASSHMEVQQYPKPVRDGAAASGILKGRSRSSWDTVYEIMTSKSRFSIFIESDGEIIEYQDCHAGWDDLNTIIWDSEDVRIYNI